MFSVFFNILPFRIYRHLIFCDRGISRQFSSCGLCCKVVTSDLQISNIMYSRLTFERFLFPDGFSKDLLGDYMILSVHYYQGLKAKRFDEFFGSYPGLYQEFVRSPFFLYKRYLEIVGRVLLNSLQEKIYPFILSSFEGKKKTCHWWKKFILCFLFRGHRALYPYIDDL